MSRTTPSLETPAAGNGAAAANGARSSENRSAGRVLDAIDLLLRAPGPLTLSEISAQLALPKSTAHGILQTMRGRGFLVFDPQTKAYSIGLRLIALALDAPHGREVRVRARPALSRLAEEFQETALLCVYERDAVVCLDQVESPTPIRYLVRLGDRWPLAHTGAGRLYLSSLSDEAAAELVDGLDDGELEEVRRSGYAVSRAEMTEGVMCVSAPVHAHDGSLTAALCVVGAVARVAGKEEALIASLVASAGDLTRQLAASAAGTR
jgi:DNA-binding IclR family transcriptional regulator